MKITCPGIDAEIELSLPDNEGWMHAHILVRVPAFEGAFRCTIEKLEWLAFVKALQRLEASIGQDAKMSWSNMEENLELELVLTQSGALHGSYRFSPDNFSLGPVLAGSFEADQTFLSGWARSAAQAGHHGR